MKTLILFFFLFLSLTTYSQWVYKTITDGFDDPYKIAYTDNPTGAYLKMENVDGKVVFYIKGSYYCDETPSYDFVFQLGQEVYKVSGLGMKSESSDMIFFTPNLLDEEFQTVDWFKKLVGSKSESETKSLTPTPDKAKAEQNQIKPDQSLASRNIPQTKSIEQSFNNNKIALQSQKLEFAGISELQESLIEMSKQEINLLTEQRNLIKDTNAVLWMIYNNSTTASNDFTTQQVSPYSPEAPTGSPTSITRGAFNQGKNVMNMGMRQGTLG